MRFLKARVSDQLTGGLDKCKVLRERYRVLNLYVCLGSEIRFSI